jgi:hypothetical protein
MSTVRPRRVNGFTPPLTATQISTWIFLPLLVVEFCVFVSPLLPLAASIPCTLVFIFFAMSSTVFGYLAMKVDPKDPRLNDATHCQSVATPTTTWDPEEPTKQCWICDKQVGEKSMHCKFCNKCVDHFDHHCMCKCCCCCCCCCCPATEKSKRRILPWVILLSLILMKLPLSILAFFFVRANQQLSGKLQQ